MGGIKAVWMKQNKINRDLKTGVTLQTSSERDTPREENR